jgi:predicted DNA-binding transcriptional regulator YafY
MRHDKLQKELDLLLLLTQNRQFTVTEICDKMEMSRRNLYYYIDFFRESGFDVIKNGAYYSISRTSKFFNKLFETIQFTESEAVTMRQLLDNADANNLQVRNLRKKLDRFYDFKILDDVEKRERATHNVNVLYDAIKFKQMVMIKGYSSPHSNSVTNRLVEPFLFMNNNNDIRCFELHAKMNKTFRISRMNDVELLDAQWLNESEHKQIYTDLFMFSGEVKMPVKLILHQLSRNLLVEEYPDAAQFIHDRSDGTWLFEADVCSFLGIGRFVLGLYDDIQVLESKEFKDYLKERINLMKAE